MQIPDVTPDTITDLATRQIVVQLLNLIEALAAENAAPRGENQQLRDEVARLKGGSGKPDIKPSVKPAPHDHSSEAERQVRTPRGKPKKNATLTVTHEERCVVDPATLPPDAVRHGTRDTIVQRLRIAVEVVRFVREVWYLPSTQTTILAPLPPGYRGGGCPTTHAMAVLKHPDIPLHHHDMELAARRQVRKRDVSFGPQSRTGAQAWDTFQTLVATAAKRGVGFFHSLRNRIVTPATTPTFAERLAQRARIAAQPAA